MNRVLLELIVEEIRRLFILHHNYEGIKMSITLQDTQEVTLNLGLKDAEGNAGTVEGVPAWSVDDASVALVTPADDGLSALVAAGALGTATISVVVNGITQTIGITVVGGDATQISIVAGTPVDKPAVVAAAVAPVVETPVASTDTTGATGEEVPADEIAATDTTGTADTAAAPVVDTTTQAADTTAAASTTDTSAPAATFGAGTPSADTTGTAAESTL